MIFIEPDPWNTMLAHARAAYPSECCGAMLGRAEAGSKVVTAALPLPPPKPAAMGMFFCRWIRTPSLVARPAVLPKRTAA